MLILLYHCTAEQRIWNLKHRKKSNTKTISTNWFLILNVLIKDKTEAKLLLPIQNIESNENLKKAETKHY